jgi:hypothetical protein
MDVEIRHYLKKMSKPKIKSSSKSKINECEFHVKPLTNTLKIHGAF